MPSPDAAKPRPYDRAGHTASRDPHGGIKANQMAGLALGPALFLIEAMHRFRAGGCWTRGVFPVRWGKSAQHQRRQSESKNTAHTRPYAPATELGLNGRFRAI